MERIELLSEVLERQHEFIRRTDAKLLVTVPVATLMVGSLATALAQGDLFDTPHLFLYVASSASLFLVLLFSFFAMNPQVGSPDADAGSLIFAGKIHTKSLEDYLHSWNVVTDEELTTDFVAQIHVNSVIAMKKFKSISWSLSCLMFAIPLWAFSIYRLAQ